MKNVIAAAALSLVLSDFTYAHEQRDEAMMKITLPPLRTLIFKRSPRRWRASAARPSATTSGNVTPSPPATVAS